MAGGRHCGLGTPCSPGPPLPRPYLQGVAHLLQAALERFHAFHEALNVVDVGEEDAEELVKLLLAVRQGLAGQHLEQVCKIRAAAGEARVAAGRGKGGRPRMRGGEVPRSSPSAVGTPKKQGRRRAGDGP